jgi:quinol-cytochrome oxidoreductase complex cytochrome b subunit
VIVRSPANHPKLDPMSKLIALVLLIGGIILTLYGIHSTHSIRSDFSRLFTGSPSDNSIWVVIGGVVLTGAGVGGLMHWSKSSKAKHPLPSSS